MIATKVMRKAINHLFSGIVFLAVGIILQLGKISDSFDSGYIIGKYWPLLIVFYGLKYILFSIVGVSHLPNELSAEAEEEGARLLHGYNPAGGIVWGAGLIGLGMIFLLKMHKDVSAWNLFFMYWPVLLIIAGLSGISIFLLIIFKYVNLQMNKS
jgi:hypothetical protein